MSRAGTATSSRRCCAWRGPAGPSRSSTTSTAPPRPPPISPRRCATYWRPQAPFGLYHVTNAGQTTWYEFAQRTFALADLSPDLAPISTDSLRGTGAAPAVLRAVVRAVRAGDGERSPALGRRAGALPPGDRGGGLTGGCVPNQHQDLQDGRMGRIAFLLSLAGWESQRVWGLYRKINKRERSRIIGARVRTPNSPGISTAY